MRMLSSRAAYELWAESYPPTAHNPLMLAEERVVVARLHNIRASRALDLGTGSGRCVPLLARTGARVIALDLSMGMLHRNAHAHRICGDARALPFATGSFDLINASLMAGDIQSLGPWLSELARVLAPGGQLIYSDFHSSWTERGWQRTFYTPTGEECALPRAPHNLADHRTALEDAALTLRSIDDVRLEPTGRWRFRALRHRSSAVAVVIHAQKGPC